MPAIPKKLRSILKRINRELSKYAGKGDAVMPLPKAEEVQNILCKDANAPSWEKSLALVEDAVVQYYKAVDVDASRSDEYVRLLHEMSRSGQLGGGKAGDGALLQLCDHEAAMEQLAMNCDEIRCDFAGTGRNDAVNTRSVGLDDGSSAPLSWNNTDAVTIPAVAMTTDECVTRDDGNDKEDLDVLDFENFQLVDVWEDKSDSGQQQPQDEQQPQQQDASVTGGDSSDAVAVDKVTPLVVSDADRIREARVTRKKRRSRFAPLTEADLAEMAMLQQPRALGFCSTFVDEDAVAAAAAAAARMAAAAAAGAHLQAIQHQLPSVKQEPLEQTVDRAAISSKMFDVVALTEQQQQPIQEEQAVPAMDKGELCKLMLRQFHESLQQAMAGAALRGDSQAWREVERAVAAPWGVGRGCQEETLAAPSVKAREATDAIRSSVEAKMAVLLRDRCNRGPSSASTGGGTRRKLVRLSHDQMQHHQAQHHQAQQTPRSPSPTPFDQSIEASMKKCRPPPTPSPAATQPASTQPTLSTRRSAQQPSPERARLRAMMLSYKRDVEKSRCGDGGPSGGAAGGERRSSIAEEGAQSDECGMAELISKAQLVELVEQQQQQLLPVETVRPSDAGDNRQSDDAQALLANVAAVEQQLVPDKRRDKARHRVQQAVAAVDTDSEGLVTSSDEDTADKQPIPALQRQKSSTGTAGTQKVEISRVRY